MFVNFKGYLSSKLTKRMTLVAKLVGFSSGINVHAKAQLATVFMLLTPFVFLTGTRLMYWRDEAEMKLLLRLYCAIVLTRYLHDCHIGVMAGHRVAVMETGMMGYMSHCKSTRFLRGPSANMTQITLLRGSRRFFWVSLMDSPQRGALPTAFKSGRKTLRVTQRRRQSMSGGLCSGWTLWYCIPCSWVMLRLFLSGVGGCDNSKD